MLRVNLGFGEGRRKDRPPTASLADARTFT